MTTTTEERQHEVATKLAAVPTKSTAHMELQERIDGIEQMLDDLARLAAVDGCISAAWALEKLIAVADAAERIYAGPGEAEISYRSIGIKLAAFCCRLFHSGDEVPECDREEAMGLAQEFMRLDGDIKQAKAKEATR